MVGIVDYVATYRVRPVTNDPGRSFVEWWREFRLVEGTDVGAFLPFLETLLGDDIARVKARFANSPLTTEV